MMISRDENLVQGRDGKLRKIFPSPAPGRPQWVARWLNIMRSSCAAISVLVLFLCRTYGNLHAVFARFATNCRARAGPHLLQGKKRFLPENRLPSYSDSGLWLMEPPPLSFYDRHNATQCR
ncbi:hypothetical protein [Herbaspirillum robiniae]|uniref:hypothetical protein n=1 Tax=Herbaspirillum robiniae TaxID=2014887 RepID=UPI00101AE67E|nr:hypothetical protein [Herbaspirillum robiniae]